MAGLNISDERFDLLTDAVHELDKLARIVPDLVPLDEGQAYYAVRGICGRMLRLTSVLMTGLNEGDASEDEGLRRVLELSGHSQG